MHCMSFDVNAMNLPLQSMCVALERARQAAGGDSGPWTVGLRDDAGALLASAMLDSYAQVKAFAREMEGLGYVQTILEAHENIPCCDFSFRSRGESPVPQGNLLHS